MTAARDDGLYLQDILEAAEAVASFLDGQVFEAFYRSDMVRSAVLQKLIIMGEAANQISVALKVQYPEVEWREVIAFRNFVIHEYFAIDWTIVWKTASTEVPVLAEQIAAILDTI